MIPGLLCPGSYGLAQVKRTTDLGSVRGLYLETGLQSLADQWPGCFMQKGPQAGKPTSLTGYKVWDIIRI